MKLNHAFTTALLFSLLALSLSAWTNMYRDVLEYWVYGGVLLMTAVLTWRNPRHGVYLLLAELVLGSQGQLLMFELGDQRIGIRLGLFVVVFLVWLFKALAVERRELSTILWHAFPAPRFALFYDLLLATIIFGVGLGSLNEHDTKDIFNDSNNYFYLGFALLTVNLIKTKAHFTSLLATAIGAFTALFIVTVLAFAAFAHGLAVDVWGAYLWSRDARLFEITPINDPGGLWRVFSQSHIYLGVVGSLAIAMLLNTINQQKLGLTQTIQKLYQDRTTSIYFAVSVMATMVLVISYSRSFWLGAGLVALSLGAIMLAQKWPWRHIWQSAIWLGLVGLVAVGLTTWVANAGSWLGVGEGSFGVSTIRDRVDDAAGAAVSTRWNQLDPLGEAILASPVFGHGFGKTVTYASNDPRIAGDYTTFAFEWGYLDTILETGLIGLGLYLGFLLIILTCLWQTYQRNDDWLALGMLLSVLFIMFTNISTPYLNHPLGIGWVVVALTYLGITPQSSLLTKNSDSLK